MSETSMPTVTAGAVADRAAVNAKFPRPSKGCSWPVRLRALDASLHCMRPYPRGSGQADPMGSFSMGWLRGSLTPPT
jgi:hypothetical protein